MAILVKKFGGSSVATPEKIHGIVNRVLKEKKPGDKIVVEGVQTLKDGQTITPITPEQKEAKYQQHLKDQKEGNIATAFK